MLPQVDFDRTDAVSDHVRTVFRQTYPGQSDAWLARVCNDIDRMFAGRSQDYSAIDLKYHDLRHTLMATVCMTQILEGISLSGSEPRLGKRDFELAIAAVLLHDSGYLKLKSDHRGTGAKYTYCHILRSCAFAAAYLPEVGATDQEVDQVVAAINCTGPNSDIEHLKFHGPIGRLVGCALATADYLGQMADPGYAHKLAYLYGEFEESDNYVHVARERRTFSSADDLARRTPGFWSKIVRPRLDADFQGVHRFLERPLGSHHNAYLDAIDANIDLISQRTKATVP
jgi:hypothetical protein